jgi:hypothetical protein
MLDNYRTIIGGTSSAPNTRSICASIYKTPTASAPATTSSISSTSAKPSTLMTSTSSDSLRLALTGNSMDLAINADKCLTTFGNIQD